jgi:hypothetical protein
MSEYAIELYFHEIRAKRAVIVIKIWGATDAPMANAAPIKRASTSFL